MSDCRSLRIFVAALAVQFAVSFAGLAALNIALLL